MFGSLGSGRWFPPGPVALVCLRAVSNGCLVTICAAAAGTGALVTAVVGGLAAISVGGATLAVLSSRFGLRASYVEVSAQLGVFPVAGYAVWTAPSLVPVVAFGAVAAVAAVLLLATIPVYGDAFVAP